MSFYIEDHPYSSKCSLELRHRAPWFTWNLIDFRNIFSEPCLFVDQSFSASALPTCGAKWFCVAGGCLAHGRMFISILVLHTLDANTAPLPGCDKQEVSRHCQMSQMVGGEQNHPKIWIVQASLTPRPYIFQYPLCNRHGTRIRNIGVRETGQIPVLWVTRGD